MNIQTQIDELIKTHGKERKALMPILQDLAKQNRFLSKETLQYIGIKMDISAAEVYGTASFYSFLDITRRGENVIRVCKTISCDMKNKQLIVDTIKKRLNIGVGETSHDNKFTLLETNCMGHCHEGPVMLVNDDIYTNLTPQKTLEIIDKYSRG
ncbi:MAG: NAD(P)H-dependent oxidoreductase subunit E [Oligoflexia bacterium]|nr:NAD(P)H-dependent oxidoreductase subunit E [Oligoflexia bacterium]